MTSSVASKKVSMDPENFLKYLECPVSLEPLITAVTLCPCMHKINEGPAKRNFRFCYTGGVKEVQGLSSMQKASNNLSCRPHDAVHCSSCFWFFN